MTERSIGLADRSKRLPRLGAQLAIGLVNSVEANLGLPRKVFPRGILGACEGNEGGNRGYRQGEGRKEETAHHATLTFVTIRQISSKYLGKEWVVVVAVALIVTKVEESSFSTHAH